MKFKGNPFYLNDGAIIWIKEKFDSFSIKEKIGQIWCPNVGIYNPIVRTQKILIEMLIRKIPIKGKSPVDAFCGLEDAKP